MSMQGEHTSPGLSRREEDPVHPKETGMRPACPGLPLPLSPWPKRMTGDGHRDQPSMHQRAPVLSMQEGLWKADLGDGPRS